MSTNENTQIKDGFDGFKGLDTSSPVGSGRIVSLKNFKQLSDGSVVKRGGFKLLLSLDGKIRGEKAYVDGGEEVILAVAEDRLYRISVPSGEYVSDAVFNTTEGDAAFFEFRGKLYIIDGNGCYVYNGGVSIAPAYAYAPLYSSNKYPVPINSRVDEPLNLICPRVRFNYKGTNNSISRLVTNLKVSSVDGICNNGQWVDKSLYTLQSDGVTILFNNDIFGSIDTIVTVYASVADEANKNEDFDSCTKANVFDSFSNSRVFVYGGNDENRFYVSEPIRDVEELLRQQELYGDTVLPLYFPKNEQVCFGGMEKITAMCRVYDRMLIFTKHRAFATESLNKPSEYRGVVLDVRSHTVGCSSTGAVAQIDGVVPVTVSYGGVYKWKLNSDFDEDFVFSKMSGRVEELMSPKFYESARLCYNRSGEELWFGNCQTGEVLIYNTASEMWYTYTGIYAERFVEVGAGVAFVNDRDIYIFNDGECDITDAGARQIEAYMESAYWCFPGLKQKKHISGIHLVCELDGGNASAVLDDGEILDTINISSGGGVEVFDLRLRGPRAHKVKLKLTAAGLQRQRLYGIKLFAE